MGPWIALPSTFAAIGVIIGGSIVGLLFLVGVFGDRKQKDRKDAEEANEYVIKSLKAKIEVLEGKVDETTKVLIETNKRLDSLQKENQSLKELLQGRDSRTQQFQEAGFKAIEQASQLLARTATIEQRVDKILDIIEHRQVVVTKIHDDIQDALDKNKR